MNSRPYGIAGFVCLLVLFIAIVPTSASFANEREEINQRRAQGLLPACDMQSTIESRDYCKSATVRDNFSTEFTCSEASELVALIDDAPGTFVTKECAPGQWLDIRFFGARKWVNFIEIQYLGRRGFEFELFDAKGENEPTNVISTSERNGPGSTKIMTVEVEPVLAKGLRWSWTTEGLPAEEIDIYDISAWFYQVDPDNLVNLHGDGQSDEPSLSPLEIAYATITSNDRYTPGSTRNIVFVLSNASSDAEWLDEATITFIPGVTVNTATDFVVAANPSHYLEYDGTTGDNVTVTWFDHDGGSGNIYSTESAEAIISINFDAGISGNVILPYTISGDDWGSPPHDVAGTLILEEDHFTDPDPNDGTNWVLCETAIAGIGEADIIPFWNIINGLPDWCPSASHYCHLWLPGADWSGDFKRVGSGGGEHIHSGGFTGMDYHDLSVVVAHGGPGRIRFSTGPPPASMRLRPRHITDSWGDRDAEWFCAYSCYVYTWDPPNNWPWKWADGFNGAHLQCGFTTTAYASNGAFLSEFANGMISSGAGDPAFTIPTSWFLASALTQPGIVCALVLSDGAAALSDHLWGQGPVSNDPAPPQQAVWAIWDPPITADESRFTSYPPPPDEEELAAIASIAYGQSTVTLPSRSATGAPIKTTEELYRSDPAEAMTVYTLVPLVLDSAFMYSLTMDLCANYGIMCAADIGQDADGNWWATEDEHAVWGDYETGAIQYVNMDDYLALQSSAPSLPSPSSATTAAEMLLSDLGIPPTGSYSTQVSYNIQSAYDPVLEEIIPTSSYEQSVNTDFGRAVSGYTVLGAAGRISVTFGEGYSLQHFTRGAWHDLVNPVSEDIIPVVDALNLLTTHGEDATIGGIPPIMDTLLVTAFQYGYYAANGEYETDILEPIYIFTCFAVDNTDSDTTECEVYVPSRASLLRGEITAPSHGNLYDEGDPIVFMGTASGGQPPYDFDWYSDVDGHIGTGSEVVVSDLSVPHKDKFLKEHSITLTVTDDEGNSSSMTIAVTVENLCCTMTGDLDMDSQPFKMSDVVQLVNFFNTMDTTLLPCIGNADIDGNCVIDTFDLIELVCVAVGSCPYTWHCGTCYDISIDFPYCDCIPGEADGSAAIDIDDVVYLVGYIFLGGPVPSPYALCSGDATCDCTVDIDDVVYLINYIFSGGPAPCSCDDWLSSCGPPLRSGDGVDPNAFRSMKKRLGKDAEPIRTK